ncbi:hypothetical protein [Alkaliphilus serpentinus]|uniref:hypothetical protein n=1 Tax=Alkaliphilus serpentinus TaxID=1482731 RepID=UPI00186578BD|nr:hypothetical protein [Alkaliphilus serpentinus]
MSVINLSLGIINLDIKRNITERNMKLQKSLQTEERITEALRKKDEYHRNIAMNLF